MAVYARGLTPDKRVLSLVSSVTVWRTGGIGKPSPIDVVGEISPRPLLLIHGAADDIVPPSHSQRLFEGAGQPKELWIAPGRGHVVIVNEMNATQISFPDPGVYVYYCEHHWPVGMIGTVVVTPGE